MLYPPLVVGAPADRGGCGFYRVIWPLLAAQKAGVIQLRMPVEAVFLPADMIGTMRPDAILFQRSHTEPQIRTMKEYRKATDSLFVYTIDDWIDATPKYSPHYKEIPPRMGKEVKLAIKECDRLIVTNPFLANIYGHNIDTYVIPNYLPFSEWGESYYNPDEDKRRDSRPRIGWSGGAAHAGDLEILHKIAQLLGNSVVWVFSGMTPEGFNANNAEFIAPQGSDKYPKVLPKLRVDLALAPLLNNDFNRAKSSLRVLEYAACGYPTIASDVLPYKDMPVDLLPYEAEAWADLIKHKLFDLDKLHDEGRALHEWVWSTHKLEDHVDEYSKVFSFDGAGFEPYEPIVEPTVDVIVTAYDNYAVLKPCIDSILESKNETPYELIIVDNGCTDQITIEYINSLQNITTVKVNVNEGYIKGINTGILQHPNRDVIALNSDTTVYGDWIDRLYQAAYLDAKTASVTPLTNNGTLAAYPQPHAANVVLDPKRLDGLAATFKLPPTPVPTPVGFCTFFKRKALAAIGLFDQHAFGKGYGEENDWAMRSGNGNWSHVLTSNVFVEHKEGQTYKNERNALIEKAMKVMAARWPNYLPLLQKWNQLDPIKSSRAFLELHDLLDRAKSAYTEVIITHKLGGGVEQHTLNYIRTHQSILFRSNFNQPTMLDLSSNFLDLKNLFPIDIRADITPVVEILQRGKIAKIIVQSTVGMDLTAPDWIIELSERSGVPYEYVVHDYYTICPRIRLVDKSKVYCGGPETNKCQSCIKDIGSFAGMVDMEYWKKQYGKFLQKATNIFAPSKDAASRISQYVGVDVKVVPHETNLDVVIGRINKWRDGNLKVVVIGQISFDKGANVLLECIQCASQYNYPIEFTVVGRAEYETILTKFSNVKILGTYKENEIAGTLNNLKGHISWFPAIWPETYSYTLSHAIRAGLWPLAFDLGAPAERIHTLKFGDVIPLSYHDQPRRILDIMLVTGTKLKNQRETDFTCLR